MDAATKHVLVRAATGPAYWTVGCMFRFLVSSVQSGGSYTTMEITVPPGEGANPHLHEAEEEQFYVLDGDLTFVVAGVEFALSPGDFLHIPRGTIHSFKAAGRHARLLATFAPGKGIERVFIDAGQLMSPEAAYGSECPAAPVGAQRHRAE